ncbi:hypothetical protein [Streptomyces sp. NPDC001675]
MEEPTGESHHHAHYSAPFSQRELHSLYLEWVVAPSDAEKKHILDGAGTTVEEFGEHFDIGCSGIADGG